MNNLYSVVKNHIPANVLATKNKKGSWEYGYDEKYDMIVISKNGTIGEVYNITALAPNTHYQPFGYKAKKNIGEWVYAFVSGGNVMLNNDIFVSNTEINKPGNYELIINGANDYHDMIDFTITSNLEGIINNNTYLDPVNISFKGDGYLNNNFIQSPYEITESGEYILKIKGENNYLETYYFSIQDEVKKASLIDFIQKVDILVFVVVLISGGIILKKK